MLADFMWSRRVALDLQRNAVMVLRNKSAIGVMEVDGRDVMSNAAAVQRFCTRGNNVVLLRQFFPTQLLLC
jgi:hypothetical protein